jgi:hypothetical protein
MFLLRAAFWLAAVAVLMPREPNLGLGAPGTPGGCAVQDSDCADTALWLHKFRAAAVASLVRVREDLEAPPPG